MDVFAMTKDIIVALDVHKRNFVGKYLTPPLSWTGLGFFG